MRVREDKSFPNGLTTATSVCHSIQQPVTKEWLLEVVEKHRWKAINQPPVKRLLEDSKSDSVPPPKRIK